MRCKLQPALTILKHRNRHMHVQCLATAPLNLAEHPLNLNNPILTKLATCRYIAHFDQIHCLLITTGMSRNVFAASRLLVISSFSLDPPNIPLAYLIFSQIQNPDVYSYNIIIKASSRTSRPLGSLHFYQKLLLQGLCRNEYTFCFLLTSCAQGLALQEGKQVHTHFIKHLLVGSVFADTSLVSMYGKCGDTGNASHVFDEMPYRSEVSWGAMMDAYINRGFLMLGLQLFAKMRCLGIKASNARLVGALCACAKQQDLVLGRIIHGHLEAMGLELNVTLGTSLVDMYSKCGAVQMAMEVFSGMPEKSVASWNCMISGLAMNGRGHMAIGLFKDMQASGLKPNGTTFVGVLHACSHAGPENDALTYFLCMRNSYGIEPTVKHYGCMVDLHTRSGKLDKATEVIRTMPVKPDTVIWGALLGGCRKHGYAMLGELVGTQIMKLQPYQISGCSSLSDLYAMGGRWEDVISMRRMMLDMDIGREPGFSALTQ
ncbi:hypothetical protein F0562_021495 [Nyssa sinensis]|uniref:Pentatricopeptide repeat-containing protein n=1 Tax=Nyssa sinensis TaxID=561372 RepID=A0A5J5BLB3_9ASTE|nr:hypothetical protein F0562_021495 [Nyssa sinensis]